MKKTLQVLAGALLVATSGAVQAQTSQTKSDATVPLGDWSYEALQILEGHTRNAESQRRLQGVAAKLRPLLAEQARGARIAFEGTDLVVRFHADREVNADGFLLRLNLRDSNTGALLLRSQEKPEQNWTTWQSEFRLNSRGTDAAKAAEASEILGAGGVEYLDVPLRAWPYTALETLGKSGAVEGLPNDFGWSRKLTTRYEFAIAVARLLDAVENGGATKSQIAALDQAENQAALQDLKREFAGEIERLGWRLDSPPAYFILDPRIRHEILQVQLSYGRKANATLLESTEGAINEWALEEMRAAQAVAKSQPPKSQPQVLAP